MNKEFFFYNCQLTGRQLRLGETGMLPAEIVVRSICDADYQENGIFLKELTAESGFLLWLEDLAHLAEQGAQVRHGAVPRDRGGGPRARLDECDKKGRSFQSVRIDRYTTIPQLCID